MNKTVKQIFRVLGVIASVLLSIALVTMLIVVPLYSVTTSLFKPDNITKIIREIDYVDLLFSSGAIEGAVGEVLEVSPEIKEEMETYVKPIVQSPIMEEVVEIYAEDISNILAGEATAFTLDEQMLSEIVNTHIDDVVTLVQEQAPEGTTVPEEEIRQKVTETVETYGGAFIKALPDAETIQGMTAGVQENSVATLALDSSTPYILYGVIAVLAVLIFLCLYGRGRGFLCLGIDSIIAATVLFALWFLLSGNGIVTDLVNSVPEVSAVLMPAVTLLISKTLWGAVVVAVTGVLFIAAYVACTVYCNKRAAQTADTTPPLFTTQEFI